MTIQRSGAESRAWQAVAPVALLTLLCAAVRPSAAVTPPGSDPKATAVADRVMQALGGEAAWNATRYLRFDLAVDRGGKTVMRRAHAWDKWTGRYRVFVNTRTGLVDRWEFVLKGEKAPPVPFDWKGWKAYGRVQLADDRVSPKDGTRIRFPVLDAPAAMPDGAFTIAGAFLGPSPTRRAGARTARGRRRGPRSRPRG